MVSYSFHGSLPLTPGYISGVGSAWGTSGGWGGPRRSALPGVLVSRWTLGDYFSASEKLSGVIGKRGKFL